ncbi:leucine-rich repeat domain-containing protein [Brachyspira aalborgi]|uniref:leucine-rich repeat domain-containing protein n=1 Tax=Brachyspira aalborgi TaxID=29522 RepID=UPI0026652557|nr:leucine-rich repeat domain-containing protein [Brachyspira aalborgi]
MRYILLFIAIFTFSCKYNITSPVGTIKDYSANSGKLFYTSSGDSDDNIETTLKKNKHSLGIYKIVVLGGDSTTILTNIKKVLNKNPHFNNVEIDLSQTKITNIPKEMFTNTTNLGKITLPDTVINIEEKAFSGCYSLNSIRFTNNLENISEGAFSNCSGLTLIILSSGALTNISKNAFYGSSSLVNLILPANISNVCDTAFSNCSQLKNLEYLGTNTNVSGSPFKNGSSISNLYLPDVDKSKTNDFNTKCFLGKKDWKITKGHIPS